MTGLRGGTRPSANVGGVTHPSRTASANRASASSGLRLGLGGTISATTRSRSVTSTVSPLAAKRTYSLSLFLSTLRPTERMTHIVATRSYLVNGSGTTHRPSLRHPNGYRGQAFEASGPGPWDEPAIGATILVFLAAVVATGTM